MVQTIIYDAVAHGSDHANLGSMIVTVMLTALFVYVAGLRGVGQRQGRTYVSKRPLARVIGTFVGKYPARVIGPDATLEVTRYSQNRTGHALGIPPTLRAGAPLNIAGRRFLVQPRFPTDSVINTGLSKF